MVAHAAGIAMISFVIAVAISIGYYQFLFIPQANAKPQLKAEVANPTDTVRVTIVLSASVPNSNRNFEPKDARAVIGLSNRIVWKNNDSVFHTVTSDDGFKDQYSGPFNTLEQQDSTQNGYIAPGKTFAFVFTKVGTYSYHCDPHPWMQGKVEIVENFA